MATIILFWFNEGLNSVFKNIINIQNLTTKPYFFILYTWSITILQWKFPTYWFKFYIWVEFKKKEAFQSLVIKKNQLSNIDFKCYDKITCTYIFALKKSTCGACVQWLFKLLHIVESWILLNIKEHIKKMNRKISRITMNTE